MEGRVGKGVITLFLCLVVLSALLFIFFENNRSESTAQTTGVVPVPPPPPVLVETVDPWAFTGIMADYDFDLYRGTDDGGYSYVAPPALDYTDPATLDDLALGELGVATYEIDPASRETTINLTLLRKPPNPPTPLANTPLANTPLPGKPTPTPRPTITPFPMSLGQSTALTYYLTAATKTVILDGGASTATVKIMPDVCDAYVAVRTPEGNIVFVNSFSHIQQNYTSYPVPIVRNSQIIRLTGPIFTFRMTSLNLPGHYKIYAVMVPPGANVWDSNNWISNLATIQMSYGIVAE
ncbi:MAG: hypothetical protein WCP22_01870 [Chlamydiota bacterium]